MLKLIYVKYKHLSNKDSEDLFSLRKKTFKDRLNWSVPCSKQMEFDEYDNHNTTYILGMYQDNIICSVRFIEIKHNNMITGTFNKHFEKIDLPQGSYIEASRLFVDKKRVSELNLNKYPVSSMLFLSMITYARKFHYEGIYAIVSYQMLIIFERSGWNIKIVERGILKENIYLIFMPIDKENINFLIKKTAQYSKHIDTDFNHWPLSFHIPGI